MGVLETGTLINIDGNTQKLVSQVNKADKSLKNLDSTLVTILDHLQKVEQGLGKVNQVTNNFNKNQKGTFINNDNTTIVGTKGSVFSSPSTRTNAYKQAADDYHKLQLQEIEVMKKQIEKDQKIIEYKNEQIKNYASEAATRRINANAKYRKTDYLNSAQHLAYEEGLGLKHKNLEGWYAAKSAHPERFLAGALNYSFSHQGARALNGIGDSVRGIGVGGRIAGDVLNTAASFLKAPAAGIMAVFKNLGQGMVDLSKAATQAYAEIESIKTQLGVVFSNQTQADAMFGQISQYAVKSPFGVQQTSELAVLLKQSGVYASDLMDTLRMLGDTAGGNMEKMKRIANNYAQIVSIGKASMLDMRQFAYAGIPIFEAVSKELGVSQQELRKLISDGKVTSDIIEKVFKDLTGINGLFENATEKGAKTLKARLQNLADARQLAFGQIGEWGVKLGTQTGGDSFVNKLVDIAEKMYDHLKTEVSTVNIEKDVQTIATRNDNIERYKNLIKFAQTINSKSLEAAFTDKLNKELAKQNPDENRSVYVQSYQNKTRGFGLLSENGITGTVVSIQQEIDELYQKIHNLDRDYWKRQNINEANPEHTLGRIIFGKYAASVGDSWFGSAPRGSDEALQKDALQERARVLEEILNALKDYNNITDELRRAIKEDAVINAQQLAFDTTNRNADGSKSLNASFNELASIYENSEEYKKKEEEKRLSILSNAQEELRKIAAKADENGNINFGGFSREEFQRLNTAGAFNATKLDVVQGNKQLTAENRAILESQFANASGKVLEEFAGSRLADTPMGREAMKEFQEKFYGLANITDDTEWFKQFGSNLNDMMNVFKQLENFNPSDSAWLQNLQQYLIQSTNKYEARVKGVNADLSTTETVKAVDQFIPLWKRILSGATGLTTNGMTGTLSTMANYRDDMAVRNMASGVLTATMKSMGLDAAMGLMRTNKSVQLAGDSGKTFQIDWLETKKAMHSFATQLSASTEVITAYKKGLEDELNTYEQLVAAGYTQAESTDLGSQKFVSTKQLEKLALGNSSQLVNAFGEVIRTKSGREYNVADVTFKNGQMFDKVGKPIEEEVVITGKLFDFIKGELPRLREEIHEANVAELNNELIKKMYDKVAPTAYSMGYVLNNGYSATTELALNNPEYIAKYLDSKMTELKNNTALSSMSNSDIYLNAITAPKRIRELENEIEETKKDIAENPFNYDLFDYDERQGHIAFLTAELDSLREYVNAADTAFKSMNEDLKKITKTETGESLIDKLGTQARDADVIQQYLNNKRYQKYGLAGPNNITPENYGGARGLRNRLYKYITGQELASDKEDYIALKLRTESDAVSKINAKRIEKYQKKGIDESEWQLITDKDLDPLTKTNEELAKMLSLSEQISLLWGEEGKNVALTFDDIGKKSGEALRNFTASSLSSSMELWGKTLATTADDSGEILKNLTQLSANMMSDLGAYITKAGLNLAIVSKDKAGVIAGLAIAAAGGGLSFISGQLSGALSEDKSNKEDNELEKLLKIKQDLSDLLKQAREDAIYYENTTRHKKAISANDAFTTRSVHDAIITPKGDVVTTDPKDYLIATKTPKTLVGGGAPVINFSVVDKSTGIRVTQQKSTYNAETNTIDFEAIIESKVQEVIATSKSDDAFAAREARLRGHSVIA